MKIESRDDAAAITLVAEEVLAEFGSMGTSHGK
jgi:hypothetical protein